MGGALWTLDLMHGLRNAFPDAQLVTNVPKKSIFPITPWMQQNLVMPQSKEELAGIKVDIAFNNLMSNSGGGFLADNEIYLPVPDSWAGKNMHIMDSWCEAVSNVLGRPVVPSQFPEFIDVGTDIRGSFKQRKDWQAFSQRHDNIAVLVVNSEDPRQKDISMQQWGDVAKGLIGKGYGVILTGSTDDRGIHFAAGKMGLSRNVMNWVSSSSRKKLAIPELFVLLGEADVVISSETGPPKVAARMGTPVVELYKNTPSDIYGARGSYVLIADHHQKPELIASDAHQLAAKRKQNRTMTPAFAREALAH